MMDEKQLLKEIAYYSRVINDHKRWNHSTQHKNNYFACKQAHTSYDVTKYKYVKAPEPIVIAPVLKNTSNKVLINPNFKRQVHINPHFKSVNPSVQKIHINPKLIDTSSVNLFQPSVQKKVVVNPPTAIYKSTKPVLLTSTTKINKTPVRKRRVSFRSKYKIVKSNTSKIRSSPLNKTALVKTRYKLDRRINKNCTKVINRKKVIRRGLSDTLRYTLFNNKIWKKPLLKTDNTQVHVSATKSKTLKSKTENNKFRRSFISLRGQKYVMDSNKKTLKLVPNPLQKPSRNRTLKKISIRGVTYVQKSQYTYVKVNMIPSAGSLKSKKLQINSHSKNNQPCPVYRRFGKCRRKDIGRCIFTHNPNQIALCRKFLQGACVDKDCLLSHKVSLEKMPTCKYFLEGCCVRSDCPYLHVKINPNADVCRHFLEGFCKEAMKCEKRHQYLCPDFEKYGKCPKRRCLYPHKSKSVVEKSAPVSKAKQKIESKIENVPSVIIELPRYYEDRHGGENNQKEDKAAVEINISEVSEMQNLESNCDEIIMRPKLGTLPSYIPF